MTNLEPEVMTNLMKSASCRLKKAVRVDTPEKRLYIQLSNPTQLAKLYTNKLRIRAM